MHRPRGDAGHASSVGLGEPVTRAGQQPIAVAMAALLLGSPASPQSPGAACDELTSNAEKLPCFRAIVRELEARVAADAGRSAAPASPAAPAPPAAASPAAADTPTAAAQEDAERIEIVDVRRGPLGNLTVRLANGETWRQLDSDNTRIVMPAATETRYAVIEEGFLGSRRMKIAGTARSFRVRRVE